MYGTYCVGPHEKILLIGTPNANDILNEWDPIKSFVHTILFETMFSN